MRTQDRSIENLGKESCSIESILDHVLWEDMEREVQKLSLSDDVKALLLSIFHREKQILLNILSGIATSYLMKYSVDRFELQISAIQNAFSKARETLFSSQGELSPYLREPNDILYIMVREAFQMSQ